MYTTKLLSALFDDAKLKKVSEPEISKRAFQIEHPPRNLT